MKTGETMENNKIVLYLIAIAMAGLGGVLKTMHTKTRQECRLYCLFAAGAMSAFTGLIVALGIIAIGGNIELAFAASGFSGWLGADIVFGLLYKRLKKETDK